VNFIIITMKKSIENLIAATAYCGDHVILTDSWRDRNVICPNSKFFYVTSGEIIIETETEKITAVDGDMVLIPAGTKHNFHLSDIKRASKYWLHIDLLINGKNLFDYYSLPRKIHVGKNEHVELLFQKVLKLLPNEKLADKLTLNSTLCSLIAFYVEHCDYVTSGNEDQIDKVISYVKSNYKEKFTLSELANIASLSEGYLIKKFKSRTGYSPLQYVNILKIDKAKTAIEQTDKTISVIMEELGFYDSAHFSKLFKNHTGYSPKRFRQINGYKQANKSI